MTAQKILKQFLCAFLVVNSIRAVADVHAVLIGASAYPALPAFRQLNGPTNDVALLRDVLRENGIPESNIGVLADGVPGGVLPNLQQVLTAMDRLTTRVKPGDWTVIYFAGHGTQQPQPPGSSDSEPDGLDEVFLPRDIGKWDGRIGRVQNGLVDDDIGRALDRLAARGARVWAIFDTCHAGDMAKGLGSKVKQTVWRSVPPNELGIPIPSATESPRTKQVPASRKHADLVLFYASRPDEPAGEEREDPPGSGPWHGVFTYRLAQAIRSMPDGSLADWAQMVTRRYREERRPYPHPYFVGDLSQRPLERHRER